MGHRLHRLIIGRRDAFSVGTLVERCTNYTMLLHLPDGYKPEQVRDALAAKIQTLPQALRESLTWDQGPEMRDWQQVKIAADIDIYFADPRSGRCLWACTGAAAPVSAQSGRPGHDRH